MTWLAHRLSDWLLRYMPQVRFTYGTNICMANRTVSGLVACAPSFSHTARHCAILIHLVPPILKILSTQRTSAQPGPGHHSIKTLLHRPSPVSIGLAIYPTQLLEAYCPYPDVIMYRLSSDDGIRRYTLGL